ncbi:hypothetical protein BOSE62_110466 [Bosea sp. 62]|nr:hypothetical protein BOSE21B_50113 [Bosea sp. 21B]CAD5287089.1 hypothetical protein BOSE46_70112 [Bosea sp. 46]CAD5301719.1 hypothetical protein BOSE7B_90574 [Bosea sp. 7B]VXB13848.1 hypothetical protein BOSE62_110466 [Bosea sp. 62]
MPPGAISNEQRGSAIRLPVWPESEDTRISGVPSMSVARLVRLAKGCPSGVSVAREAERALRSRPRANPRALASVGLIGSVAMALFAVLSVFEGRRSETALAWLDCSHALAVLAREWTL